MNKMLYKYTVLGLIFGGVIFIAFVNFAYGDRYYAGDVIEELIEKINVFPFGTTTHKVFEDGVEYYYTPRNNWKGVIDSSGIVLDGELIDCELAVFMHGGIIAPECFEIILRHELDRRGYQ